MTGTRTCHTLPGPERVVAVIAQPSARLAQSAERKQMEAGDRCGRPRRRRSQAAHDIVRSGIRQQPAKAADLAAQRAHRIADAATEREFGQRGRRRRTGKADDDRKVDAVPSSSPIHPRIGALSKQNCVTISTRIFRCASPVAPNPQRLEGVRRRRETDGPRDGRQRSPMRCRAPRSGRCRRHRGYDLNGPLAAATSPAISRMRRDVGLAARSRQKITEHFARGHFARCDMRHRIEAGTAQRSGGFDIVAIIVAGQERDRDIGARREN